MTINNNPQISELENKELEKKSIKVIKKLIIGYLIIAIICLFLIQVKLLAVIICSLQIAIAMYFYNKSNGIITIDYNTKSSQPSLFFPLLIPTVVIFAVGIIDITVLDYKSFWAPFTIYLLFFLWVIIKFIQKNEGKKKMGTYITAFIIAAAFSFGFTINSNEVLSSKAGEPYTVQITDKWVIEGRNTTYHFQLTPWGPIKNSNNIKVQHHEYEQYNPGDSVTIEYHSGLYGIPFIKLIENESFQ